MPPPDVPPHADEPDEGALEPVRPVGEDADDLARLLRDQEVVALGVRADERARALGPEDLGRERHDGLEIGVVRVAGDHAARNARSSRVTMGCSPSRTV